MTESSSPDEDGIDETRDQGLPLAGLDEGRDWLDRQHAVWQRLFDAVDDHLAAERPATAGRRTTP